MKNLKRTGIIGMFVAIVLAILKYGQDDVVTALFAITVGTVCLLLYVVADIIHDEKEHKNNEKDD